MCGDMDGRREDRQLRSAAFVAVLRDRLGQMISQRVRECGRVTRHLGDVPVRQEAFPVSGRDHDQVAALFAHDVVRRDAAQRVVQASLTLLLLLESGYSALRDCHLRAHAGSRHLFYLCMHNIGHRPALEVSISLDLRPFVRLAHGERLPRRARPTRRGPDRRRATA